jgi:hypothetical protein
MDKQDLGQIANTLKKELIEVKQKIKTKPEKYCKKNSQSQAPKHQYCVPCGVSSSSF